MGCFEYAVELRVTVLESNFDINIWMATVPRNVDVNSGELGGPQSGLVALGKTKTLRH